MNASKNRNRKPRAQSHFSPRNTCSGSSSDGPFLSPSSSFHVDCSASTVLKREIPWKDIEDQLAVILDNDPDRLHLLRSVHAAGVRHPCVLTALAYLSTPSLPDKELTFPLSYSTSVERVAYFLSHPSPDRTAKLACLRLLLTLRSPLDSGWQQEEDAVAASLCFVMCGEQEACDDITETRFFGAKPRVDAFLGR